jgi:two-component system, NarL family, nitrate/nitrite response regulator NarL
VLTADPASSAWDALGVGAAGVLSRRATPDAVRSAVRDVAGGGVALCDEAQRAVAGEIRARHPSDGPLLSAREQEVLELLADGLSAPAIAHRLQIATTTVRTHVQHLYEKLEARDRGQAVRHAMRRKLLD